MQSSLVAGMVLEALEARAYLSSVAFSAPTIVGNVTAPSDAISGDFLGNHRNDVVLLNESSAATEGNGVEELTLLEANGDGTFTPQVIATLPAQSEAMAAGDFLGNERLDIAVAVDGTIQLYLNNGDGTFTLGNTIPTNGVFITTLAVGDVNGDGLPDLVAGGVESVSVYLNQGGGNFSAPIEAPDPSPTTSIVQSLAVADLNRDGKADLVIVNQPLSGAQAGDATGASSSQGTLSIDLSNGDGTFNNVQNLTLLSAGQSVAVGDFNGDRKPDIVVGEITLSTAGIGSGKHKPGSDNGSSLQVFEGDGNGNFTSQSTQALSSAPLALQVGDYNNDGLLDLAVACADGTIQVLPGAPSGFLGAAVTVASLAPGDAIQTMVSADFNGDGFTDLIAADGATGNIFQLLDALPPISTPDPTFGAAGVVTIPFTSDALTADPEQRALVAGSAPSDNGNYSDFAIARYSTDGTLDFSSKADFGIDAHATGVTVESDGSLLVVGFVTDSHSHQHVAVAQFDANGNLDSSFGNDGTEVGPVVQLQGGAFSFHIVVQPDGKVLVSDGLGTGFSITRYNPDLTPDSTFGTDGNVTTSFDTGDTEATALLIQPDGKIVAAGNSAGHFALARYNTDGTLDTTFGFGGGQLTSGIAGLGGVTDLFFDLNPRFPGSITALGFIPGSGHAAPRPVLIRYDENGARNRKFGVHGEVVSPPSVGATPDAAAAAAPAGVPGVEPDLALTQIGQIFEAAASKLDRLQGVAQPNVIKKTTKNSNAKPASAAALALPSTQLFSNGPMISASQNSLFNSDNASDVIDRQS